MKLCVYKNFKQLADAVSRIEQYLGTNVNPEQNTITQKLNNIVDKLAQQQSFTYESTNRKLNHVIMHNLDSFFINVNILAERNGYWENIICNIKYLNTNNIEIDLSEEEKLIVSIYKIK